MPAANPKSPAVVRRFAGQFRGARLAIRLSYSNVAYSYLININLEIAQG